MNKLLAAAFIAAAFFISNADAHGKRSGPLPPGISIPALTHGQMAVVVNYRAAILDLANQQSATDETFRRLMNYGNIQATYCLWGAVPGSLTDEASPFNECAHAYLAATKALLQHMTGMASAADSATVLITQMDGEMFARGASWQLCEFSAEPFSTGAFIMPHLADVFTHWPSFVTFAVVFVLLALGLWALFRTSGRPSPGG
ncbi:hypothetical protein [Aestuariivirga litoralis]|uniref:hypothetical protein n=1 Tax=Aestuariivirga litoralis TaxID=2650924 RepID=UPI0018C6E0AF|nr:hypothetical protein [Aestuariivirga litoralis]MBG1231012.1 hypothetical protein [Aestuariivirga litoralis]